MRINKISPVYVEGCIYFRHLLSTYLIGNSTIVFKMASTSKAELERRPYFYTVKHFPLIINGKINAVEFLEAATDLISILERFGKAFAPVKYDMQGNIDKIKKFYEYNESSCLLELMLDEISKGKFSAVEAILWLIRAILFFELTFQQILACVKNNNCDIAMKKIFTMAYEGSVKQYHNWVTQQIFTFICKMSPTLPQILKSMDVDHHEKEFEIELSNYNIKLHLVRCKIDDFFKEQNLFDSNKIY